MAVAAGNQTCAYCNNGLPGSSGPSSGSLWAVCRLRAGDRQVDVGAGVRGRWAGKRRANGQIADDRQQSGVICTQNVGDMLADSNRGHKQQGIGGQRGLPGRETVFPV